MSEKINTHGIKNAKNTWFMQSEVSCHNYKNNILSAKKF